MAITSASAPALPQVPANYQSLSPIGFLFKAAQAFPNCTAVVHGQRSYDYAELEKRCCRLANALDQHGIKLGDTVSIIAPNTPAHLEAHYGVPMTGAMLNSINIRLDAATVAYILNNAETKILLVDSHFLPLAKQALRQAERDVEVIVIHDDSQADNRMPSNEFVDYEAFIGGADSHYTPNVKDEWQALSLNYTSGTTGEPKGVVYSHRGAYMNAIGNVLAWDMPTGARYLWTLPMFHCNGWCFPWSVTLKGGTHICLREVSAEAVVSNMLDHDVSHFCAAPIVLNMLVNADKHLRSQIPAGLNIMTAGAPPPASVIAALESKGASILHTYGLTEVYGPCVYCPNQESWKDKPDDERASLKARQGLPYPILDGLEVFNPETHEPVPADGETLGEIMFRGNVVMKGYLKNAQATESAFKNDWFHSGDLAVKHPDGYIEIKDRSKDIIISGGENISSIEIENHLYKHESVLAASVVAKQDEKWGECPCAFIELKPGKTANAEALRAFCRERMAHFKVPRYFVFSELPKTSTGKIQKFVLREQANSPNFSPD